MPLEFCQKQNFNGKLLTGQLTAAFVQRGYDDCVFAQKNKKIYSVFYAEKKVQKLKIYIYRIA